ncbi:hypothetical protein TNCV_4630751 [Trichonephila clavipes]|nr:hypothetical protein TNCV_4630751 [Trichonephila clavipes]
MLCISPSTQRVLSGFEHASTEITPDTSSPRPTPQHSKIRTIISSVSNSPTDPRKEYKLEDEKDTNVPDNEFNDLDRD